MSLVLLRHDKVHGSIPCFGRTIEHSFVLAFSEMNLFLFLASASTHSCMLLVLFCTKTCACGKWAVQGVGSLGAAWEFDAIGLPERFVPELRAGRLNWSHVSMARGSPTLLCCCAVAKGMRSNASLQERGTGKQKYHLVSYLRYAHWSDGLAPMVCLALRSRNLVQNSW